MIQFARIGRFTEDRRFQELDRRLVEFENNVALAFQNADNQKSDVYTLVTVVFNYDAHVGELVQASTLGQAVIISLPTASDKNRGKRIAVTRSDGSNTLTIQSPGSTVDGVASITHSTAKIRELISNGSDWITVSA